MASEMVERVAAAMLDTPPTWTGEKWGDGDTPERRHTVREFLGSTHLSDMIEVIARDAAIAAIKAMASDWQPIETAPRDGTWFLVHWKEGRITTMMWDLDYHCFTDHRTDHWGGLDTYDTSDFTHWQPLPPPPALNQEDGRGAG